MPVPSAHVNGARPEPPFPAGLDARCLRSLLLGLNESSGRLPVSTRRRSATRAIHAESDVSRGLAERPGTREVVLVVRSKDLALPDLVKVFWESHDPTQGMRQGNDIGTQYRSGIYYYNDDQREIAERSREAYQQQLSAAGYGAITTEIVPAPEFYYAEDYHQQYLSKNPGGYCGIGGTGVSCPVGLEVK